MLRFILTFFDRISPRILLLVLIGLGLWLIWGASLQLAHSWKSLFSDEKIVNIW